MSHKTEMAGASGVSGPATFKLVAPRALLFVMSLSVVVVTQWLACSSASGLTVGLVLFGTALGLTVATIFGARSPSGRLAIDASQQTIVWQPAGLAARVARERSHTFDEVESVVRKGGRRHDLVSLKLADTRYRVRARSDVAREIVSWFDPA